MEFLVQHGLFSSAWFSADCLKGFRLKCGICLEMQDDAQKNGGVNSFGSLHQWLEVE